MADESEKQIQRAVERLEELGAMDDREMAHVEADKILLEFVPDEVEEAWKEIPKWYA